MRRKFILSISIFLVVVLTAFLVVNTTSFRDGTVQATINTDVVKNVYTGNNSVGPFPFTFATFAATDITCISYDTGGVAITLVQNVDYTTSLTTVSGQTYYNGSVTLTNALASGYTLVIIRTADYLQGVSFSQGYISSINLNQSIDKLDMQIQQLAEMAGRSFMTTQDLSGPYLLRPQGGYLIGWNAPGTELLNYPIVGGSVVPTIWGAIGGNIAAQLDLQAALGESTYPQTYDPLCGSASTYDCTAAIDDAISAAGPLGAVRLSKGSYKITTGLITHGTSIFCDSGTLIFASAAATPAISIGAGDNIIGSAYTPRTILQGCILIGPGAATATIGVQVGVSSTDVAVNVIIDRIYPVAFRTGIGVGYAQTVLIENSDLQANGTNLLSNSGSNLYPTTISSRNNNWRLSIAGPGVLIMSGIGWTFEEDIFESNHQEGVKVATAAPVTSNIGANVIIKNSHFEQNWLSDGANRPNDFDIKCDASGVAGSYVSCQVDGTTFDYSAALPKIAYFNGSKYSSIKDIGFSIAAMPTGLIEVHGATSRLSLDSNDPVLNWLTLVNNVDSSPYVALPTMYLTFSQITGTTPPNGTVVKCADCNIANPCTSGGTGAIAKYLGGAWVCN